MLNPDSIWHVQMQCELNTRAQHKAKYIHVYSKLFVNVSKYNYLEKALANKNEGHYKVRTINSRNAYDYYQIRFLISIAERLGYTKY
jgi:hypothetical protein